MIKVFRGHLSVIYAAQQVS